MVQAKMINECLHAYGIHSSTLQPELCTPEGSPVVGAVRGRKRGAEGAIGKGVEEGKGRGDGGASTGCRVVCGMECGELMCCG